MSKLLILPDIHGRDFWRKPCLEGDIDSYEKVIFLGDYVDPYPFERIRNKAALDNFRDIIAFADEHPDRVVTLLGNHDLPYFSTAYRSMLSHHSRMATGPIYDSISEVFASRADRFPLATVADGILFTHAGVNRGWLSDCEPSCLDEQGHCRFIDADRLAEHLNTYTANEAGMRKLLCVSYRRGGSHECGSCVWADVHEMQAFHDSLADKNDSDLFSNLRQVFGHTQQASMDAEGNIVYGIAWEIGALYKMLDTRHAYILDSDTFTVSMLDNGYGDIIPNPYE